MPILNAAKVRPAALIGLFFAIILTGIIVGMFITSAFNLNKSFDSCTDQGGVEIIKTDAVQSCPEGYPKLFEEEKTICCLNIK